jgi:hypothetical protein
VTTVSKTYYLIPISITCPLSFPWRTDGGVTRIPTRGSADASSWCERISVRALASLGEARACRMAFRFQRRLPYSVLGPALFLAFCQFAAICLFVAISSWLLFRWHQQSLFGSAD